MSWIFDLALKPLFVVLQGLRSLVVPFLAGGSSRRLLSRYRKLGAVLGTGQPCVFHVLGLRFGPLGPAGSWLGFGPGFDEIGLETL